MPSKISHSLIDQFAAGPSASRASAVKSLQENLRTALEIWAGEGNFETFLQGSYRNGTAIADINDVDIVALYTPWKSPATDADWNRIFTKIAGVLKQTSLVTGTVETGDKCVTLTTSTLKADIVPALRKGLLTSSDPIAVYSRRESGERPNYPRVHYQNGVAKQRATKDAYKPTVRLFKRWARQYPGLKAPSFYIECAVHSVADTHFDSYLPASFLQVGIEICGYTRTKVINSVAGDKDILVPSEWDPDDFETFTTALLPDLRRVLNAVQARTEPEANRHWRAAFGA